MADPTVIRFKDRWYLFPSAGMLWHSDDLLNWTYHPIEPFDPGYAPTVAVKGDWLYLTASWDCGAIWRARDPLGPWERLGEYGEDADGNPCWLRDHEGQPVSWGDPCLFVEDDGTMYCYCNLMRQTREDEQHPWNLHPDEGVIYGVRLRDDTPYQFAEAPVPLITFDRTHWWERMGEANQIIDHPVLEGAWMTKWDGRYYLQYSSNGTEYKNYALGCYVADKPLGPFTLQQNNPILIHRGGLVNGTAHHSLVEGPDQRLWCFYTCRINNSHPMERRIGMDPVRFNDLGEMYVDGPSEIPQFAPGHNPHPDQSNDAGLLQLSQNCSVSASSATTGREARYAVDNSLNTWWQAADGAGPHWLEVDLLEVFPISAARTIFADCGLCFHDGVHPGPYQFRLLGSLDRQTWHVVCDQTGNSVDRHIAYDTWEPQQARYVRLEILAPPPGMTVGVLSFTIFGRVEAIIEKDIQ